MPCLFGLAYAVEQVGYVVARLVAVGILANHSGTEYGQLVILAWRVGEHAVKFLLKALLAHQLYKSVNVVLYAPHIVPCIALANVWCIFVGAEMWLELSLAVAWLHECCGGVILVTPVLGTAVEYGCNAVVSHSLGHACNAVVIKGILQCARHCPVVGIVRVYNIVWHVSVLLVEPYAAVFVAVGGGNAGSKCLLRVETGKSLQVRICNHGHGVVANHHIGLASPHVPHRQAAMLLIEYNE